MLLHHDLELSSHLLSEVYHGPPDTVGADLAGGPPGKWIGLAPKFAPKRRPARRIERGVNRLLKTTLLAALCSSALLAQPVAPNASPNASMVRFDVKAMDKAADP